MRHQLCLALGLFLAVIAADHDAYGQPTPVTTCGQSVEGDGVLTGDLDCSASSGAAVVLQPKARLDLAGFTLTASDIGVQCQVGKCGVKGPGTIRRPTFDGSTDNVGIQASRRVRAVDVTLENWRIGVRVLGLADIRGCTFNDGRYGVVGTPVKVIDSSFTGNEGIGVIGSESTKDGIHYRFYSARVRRSTFSANGIDIGSYKKPRVRETSCTTSDKFTIPATPYGGGDEWNVCS